VRDARLGLLCLLAVLTADASCREDARAPQAASARSREYSQHSHAPASASSTALLGPVLAHAGAFELVATSAGATLVWAAGTCAQGLRLQRFDVDGAPVGAPLQHAACGGEASDPAAEITDVTAAAGGGRIGVVWLVRDRTGARLFGTFGSDSAENLAPTLPLGAADNSPDSRSSHAVRGQLWLTAADTGQMRMAWRGPAATCSSGNGTCAQLLSTVFPPQPGAPRRVDTREVPVACARLLLGTLWHQGTWYDAFCTVDVEHSRPSTEVYAIRPEIFYAEAMAVLEGCAPVGLAPSSEGVFVFGECADGLHAELIGGRGFAASRDARIERDLTCEVGRPVLSVGGATNAAVSYKLAGPRDRLELWLPERLAPPGSRAVFTGRRLLLAKIAASRLTVSGSYCDDKTIVSVAPVML